MSDAVLLILYSLSYIWCGNHLDWILYTYCMPWSSVSFISNKNYILAWVIKTYIHSFMKAAFKLHIPLELQTSFFADVGA